MKTLLKPIDLYLIRFGLVTGTAGSLAAGFLGGIFGSSYGFTYNSYLIPICFLTLPMAGLFTHFRLGGYTHFVKEGFLENWLDYTQMRIIYFVMYVAALFVISISSGAWMVVFGSSILSAIAGLLVVRKFNKIPSKNSENRYYQNGNSYSEVDFSIMRTGDNVDAPSYTSHGSAHWLSDYKKNILTDRENDEPTYKGLWIGGGFFHRKEGNLVSLAPPGTGKGGALIIPNLLWERNYSHSFVVFDPKGTNACITARYQKEQGKKVIIVDPMNLQKASQATHGIPSAHFNPLDHIKDDIFNGVAQIANLLIPDDPKGEKFWNQDARNLVQAILMHIMTSENYAGRRNLITFYKEMLTANFLDLFGEMLDNHSLNDAISDSASSFSDMLAQSEGVFSSVRSIANSSIKWLSNPHLQECMKRSDFDPEELEEGGVALYLCQPIQNKEGFATFSRLLIGFCLRANSRPVAKPKAWVYYLLDEFPTMGIFPEVIECLAYSREYKMRLWIFAQSLSQLDQTYTQEGRNQILGNAGVLQAFGVTDQVTQEYISKRIGNQTIKQYSNSTSTSRSYGFESGGSSDSDTRNESFHGVPLISPENVQFDPNIITIAQWGPMRLPRWQYWENSQEFAGFYFNIFHDGRADKNPNIS